MHRKLIFLKNLKKEVDKLKGLAADTTYTAHPGGALPRDVIKIPALAGVLERMNAWIILPKSHWSCVKSF